MYSHNTKTETHRRALRYILVFFFFGLTLKRVRNYYSVPAFTHSYIIIIASCLTRSKRSHTHTQPHSRKAGRRKAAVSSLSQSDLHTRAAVQQSLTVYHQTLFVCGVDHHGSAALAVAGQLGNLGLDDGRAEAQELRPAHRRPFPRPGHVVHRLDHPLPGSSINILELRFTRST